jgi:hypothetical protein
MPLDKHGFLGSQMETWIKECRERYPLYFLLASEVNEVCQTSMFELKANSKDVQTVLTATLYSRVVTNYQSVIVLCERGMRAEARAMLRVMLETIFNLCAVAKDQQLAKDFVLEDQVQRLKFLNKFRTLHGGHLPPDVDPREIDQLDQELKADVVNIKPRKTEQWAREAGLHEWYLTVYSVLSGSVHSKVRDLERYVVRDGEGNITNFQWGPDDSDLKNQLATAIEGILVALGCAAALFGLKKNDAILKFRRRVRELHPVGEAK